MPHTGVVARLHPDSGRIPSLMSSGERAPALAAVILPVLALVAAAGFGGCVSDNGAVRRPLMPTASAVAAPEHPPVSFDEALADARGALAQNNFPAVVRALETLAPGDQPGAVRILVRDLAQADFTMAERVADALPRGQFLQAEAADVLARAQVARDPALATQWALAEASPAIASRARQTVAEQLIAQEPETAMQRLLALPDSPARREMLGYAAAGWTQRDAEGALAWVRTMAAGETKDRIATSMGFALAQSDPVRAVGLLATLPEGRDRMAVIGAIGQTWIARDAEQAWRWARQLPAGATREAALAGIETGLGGAGSRAVRDDPTSAGRAGSLAAAGGGAAPLTGLARDDELRRTFAALLDESPARAAGYLTSLPPADRRDDLVDELMRRWLPTNPEAARTWIDQNILNQGRREELIRAAEARGY